MNEYMPPSQPGRAPCADHRVGRDQHLEAVGEQVLDLVGVPVAGVSEHRPRPLGHAGVLEFAQRGVDHRFELPEVR